MAKAEVIQEVVTTIKGVTLTLTLEEAKTLHSVLRNIGGHDGKGGHRDRIDAIGRSLYQAGVPHHFDDSFIQKGMYIKV